MKASNGMEAADLDPAVSSWLENNKLVIVVGVAVFSITNYLTRLIVPASASNTFQQRWKWKNVATSLIHSFITGLWAPILFYQVS